MRELRFRAWNKAEQFLDTAWSIDFEHGLVCHRAHNESDLDDCILMQYAGLEDAAGRAIFEGDIFEDPKGRKRVVTFKEGMFCAENPKTGVTLGPLAIHLHGAKVIGNVFENEDLLKEV